MSRSRKRRIAVAGSSIVTVRPCSSTITRLQMRRTRSDAWDTKMIVRPSRWKPRTRSRHFCWKASSPTDSTSSTSRTSGSTLMATANPRRTYMPDE